MKLYLSFYFDEDIAVQVAAILAKENYDVLTARDAGMLTRSDTEQLEFAINQARTVVTHNRDDFENLHSEYLHRGDKHYGIVILRRRQVFNDMAKRLLKLLDRTTSEEMENQLRYV